MEKEKTPERHDISTGARLEKSELAAAARALVIQALAAVDLLVLADAVGVSGRPVTAAVPVEDLALGPDALFALATVLHLLRELRSLAGLPARLHELQLGAHALGPTGVVHAHRRRLHLVVRAALRVLLLLTCRPPLLEGDRLGRDLLLARLAPLQRLQEREETDPLHRIGAGLTERAREDVLGKEVGDASFEPLPVVQRPKDRLEVRNLGPGRHDCLFTARAVERRILTDLALVDDDLLLVTRNARHGFSPL